MDRIPPPPQRTPQRHSTLDALSVAPPFRHRLLVAIPGRETPLEVEIRIDPASFAPPPGDWLAIPYGPDRIVRVGVLA